MAIKSRPSSTSSARQQALIIGCGDLGQRVAALLLAQGFAVTGARRQPQRLPSGIAPLALDVTDGQSVRAIADKPWDVVIVALTARGEAAYQSVYVDGTRNILANLQAEPLLLFASSTSVYAQCAGEWIDESSPTEPQGFSGQCLLQAESLLRGSRLPSVTIRFSGIYGGGRFNHLLSVLERGRIAPEQPLHYSNRIHVDDCARLIVHLLGRHLRGEAVDSLYLASDGQPATLCEIMRWLAAQNGIDTTGLLADYLPKRGGNRRCSNKRLLESGFQFQYSNYQQGFGDHSDAGGL